MINRAVLTGRLTRDVELRYTQSGMAVASFTLAVDRRFTNQDNEREADFINCVIWRKAAEAFANYTHKGSLVGLEGRIQTRNYENQEGTRVYVTEVVVENFSFLEPKGTITSDSQSSAPQSTGTDKQTNQQNDPFSGSNSIDIKDEDLPF